MVIKYFWFNISLYWFTNKTHFSSSSDIKSLLPLSLLLHCSLPASHRILTILHIFAVYFSAVFNYFITLPVQYWWFIRTSLYSVIACFSVHVKINFWIMAYFWKTSGTLHWGFNWCALSLYFIIQFVCRVQLNSMFSPF